MASDDTVDLTNTPFGEAWHWTWHYLAYVAGGGLALLIFLLAVAFVVGLFLWIGSWGDDPEPPRGNRQMGSEDGA